MLQLAAEADNQPFLPPAEPLLAATYARESISLNGKWHYIVDPYKSGYYDYRRRPYESLDTMGSSPYFKNSQARSKGDRIEYNFDLSPTLRIPGSWSMQVPELTWYEGALWLKRDFTLHKARQKRYFIHFGAINYEAHIWLNGKRIGYHLGGFTPFNFEITEELENGDNFLIVMADNTRHPHAVPTVATDWWNHGGITRDVKIVEVPETFIEDFSLQLDPSGELAEGWVRTNPARANLLVNISLPEAEIALAVQTGADGRAVISFPAASLTRWDTHHPKLYDVTVSVENDSLTDRIGFRTIRVEGFDILLNGRKVFLRGICLHEENPMTGRRNHSPEDARQIYEWVRELDANFVRLAHYPHNEHMPRMADELGILLWEEIPVYWSIAFDRPETLENARNQLHELIARDKNRASVIVWSMANETARSEARYQFLRQLVEETRKQDNTRLISAAMELRYDRNHRILDDPFGAHTDIISFNQYHGWYGGDRDTFPDLKWVIQYAKPVIVSEWGGGALHGFRADKDTIWSEDFQAHLYEKTLEGIINIPGLSGFTPWILADFRSPRRALPHIQDMWNRKGIIGEGGHKKQAFFILRDFYRNLPPSLEETSPQ